MEKQNHKPTGKEKRSKMEQANDLSEQTEYQIVEDGDEQGEGMAGDVASVSHVEAELLKRIADLEKQCEEYVTLAQRVQADFDNYRRRNNAVRTESFEDGCREVLSLMLPVLDNLERASDAAKAEPKVQEGVEMVARQMREAMQKRGVEEIDCLGKPFDPAVANAVLQGDESEGEPGTVCAVFQKGYQTGKFVLRHAMVKVVAG